MFFYKIPSNNEFDINLRVSAVLSNTQYIPKHKILEFAKTDKVILELVPECLFKETLITDVFLDDNRYAEYKYLLENKNIFLAFSFVREHSPHTQFLIPIIKAINKYPSLEKKILYFSLYDVKNEVLKLCNIYNLKVPKLTNITYEHFEVDAYCKIFKNKQYKKYNPTRNYKKNSLYVSINCKPEKFNRLNLALILQKNNLLQQGNFRLNRLQNTDYLPYVHKSLVLEYEKYIKNWNDSSEIASVNVVGTHTGYPYPIKLYKSSYISLIAETHFDDVRIFHTEKTYRTIANEHPFIYLGPNNSLRDLQNKGYHTFSPFINEDYDNISDDLERLQSATANLKNKQNIIENYQKLKEISSYNVEVLKSRAVNQIQNIEHALLGI